MSEDTIPYFKRMQMIKLGLLPKEAVAKEKKPIAKKSEKRKQEDLEKKQMGTDVGLDKWFEERRKEMTGSCKHCGGKSCKDNDEFYKFSICHILPKAYFPSVATHEYNFIELCFWNNNCHGNMDNKVLDLIDMNCWDEIVTKFCIMYPMIAKEERRRIPEVLLQYVKTEI